MAVDGGTGIVGEDWNPGLAADLAEEEELKEALTDRRAAWSWSMGISGGVAAEDVRATVDGIGDEGGGVAREGIGGGARWRIGVRRGRARQGSTVAWPRKTCGRRSMGIGGEGGGGARPGMEGGG
ncbi:hypothetical protein OsI_35922 [Oryza sativa Indica Group]|uniref:Uncharacterized protein n=1 Tax=Oryza sativa subsp. indica TaxID=39946 RepID=B8BK81_ORYSI|nr:hypothetical protein OsI_35922 [Oryza sativa Indica Group]